MKIRFCAIIDAGEWTGDAECFHDLPFLPTVGMEIAFPAESPPPQKDPIYFRVEKVTYNIAECTVDVILVGEWGKATPGEARVFGERLGRLGWNVNLE